MESWNTKKQTPNTDRAVLCVGKKGVQPTNCVYNYQMELFLVGNVKCSRKVSATAAAATV